MSNLVPGDAIRAVDGLYQKVVTREMTAEHLRWFSGLSETQRDNLASLGYPDINQRFVLEKDIPEERQSLLRVTPETFKPHPQWRIFSEE